MAMFETQEAMDKELKRLTETLEKLDPTSEEYEKVRKSIDCLCKLRNDEYKIDTEDIAKRDLSEAELKIKQNELELRKAELEASVKKQEADAQQKADELAIKERELALAEKKLEAERQKAIEDAESKKYEIEVIDKQHEADIASRKADRIHDYVINGLQMAVGAAKLVATIGFCLIVADQGYRFEENGTPTSRTFREQTKNAFDLLKDAFKSK